MKKIWYFLLIIFILILNTTLVTNLKVSQLNSSNFNSTSYTTSLNNNEVINIESTIKSPGIRFSPVIIKLLNPLINKINDSIKKHQTLEWQINDAKIALSTTKSTAAINNLPLLIKQIINEQVEIKRETYQTYFDYFGFKSKILVNYYDKVNHRRNKIDLNTYEKNFSVWQLVTGFWKLSVNITFIQKDINYTDSTNNAKIQLPNYQFYFYQQQLLILFNKSIIYKNQIVNYIYNIKQILLNEINIKSLFHANKIGFNKYSLGSCITSNQIINDEYFYLQIKSPQVTGEFNLLVKNLNL